jgi:hypothetical protein
MMDFYFGMKVFGAGVGCAVVLTFGLIFLGAWLSNR